MVHVRNLGLDLGLRDNVEPQSWSHKDIPDHVKPEGGNLLK